MVGSIECPSAIIKSNKNSFIINAAARAPITALPAGTAEVLFPIYGV